MADAREAQRPIVEWLTQRGHSEAEIGMILERLARHDQLTTVDALMNAISTGEIDLAAIVAEYRQQ